MFWYAVFYWDRIDKPVPVAREGNPLSKLPVVVTSAVIDAAFLPTRLTGRTKQRIHGPVCPPQYLLLSETDVFHPRAQQFHLFDCKKEKFHSLHPDQ